MMEENEKENAELEKNENSNENQQLQNNKQKNKSTLIIIVLLVIIAGLLVFIAYDKVFKKDTESNKKADDKQQEENKDNKDDKDNDNQKDEKPKDALYNLPDGEISITNEDLVKYHTLFKASNSVEHSFLNSLNKEVIEKSSIEDVNRAKIGFAITKIKPVKKSCSLIYLNPNDYYYCGSSLEDMEQKDETTNEVDMVTKEEVDNKLKEIFGNVFEVPKDNVISYEPGTAYLYDSNSKMFAKHSIRAGSADPDVYEETITSARKNGDLLTIESKQSVSYSGAPESLYSNKVTLTLKWNEEVGRYVFCSRESIKQ